MAPEDVLGDPELRADATDLVLEETAQRLDHLERHDLGQPADVVVRLDACARLRLTRARLDHVGVDRALHEQVDAADAPRLLLEAADELLPDDGALLLRIADPIEATEEALRRVDLHQTQPRTEGRDDLLGFVRAQEPGVDEDAREPVTDRARDECGRDS